MVRSSLKSSPDAVVRNRRKHKNNSIMCNDFANIKLISKIRGPFPKKSNLLARTVVPLDDVIAANGEPASMVLANAHRASTCSTA